MVMARSKWWSPRALIAMDPGHAQGVVRGNQCGCVVARFGDQQRALSVTDAIGQLMIGHMEEGLDSVRPREVRPGRARLQHLDSCRGGCCYFVPATCVHERSGQQCEVLALPQRVACLAPQFGCSLPAIDGRVEIPDEVALPGVLAQQCRALGIG